jgi:mRNA interferase MazF
MRDKIVLVRFPFDEISSSKVRPALCLTETTGPYHHVIVAFISSQCPREQLDSDLPLRSEEPSFAETGLHVSSMLRLHRVLTITKDMIRRELGTLPDTNREEVKQKLLQLFELGNGNTQDNMC